MISYYSENAALPKFKRRPVAAWITAVAAVYGKRIGDISYIFCDDNKILEVNRQYLQHDYFTDIITFDYCEDDILSGDLFISLDTVASNAAAYGVSQEQELWRVMIHGVLHLCGQNDKSDEDAAEMRRKEDAALALIAF